MTAIEPGNQLDRSTDEFYFSEPLKVEAACKITNTDIQAQIPEKTWVTVHLRCAATPEELETATWTPAPAAGSMPLSVPAGHLVQYRLTLGATLSLRSPRVTRVAFTMK